jgi:hypothetical protein
MRAPNGATLSLQQDRPESEDCAVGSQELEALATDSIRSSSVT